MLIFVSEYDALSRSGINDPKSFIEKSVQSQENLQYLKNCAIGQGLLDQIEASVEEAVASQSWINILVKVNSNEIIDFTSACL